MEAQNEEKSNASPFGVFTAETSSVPELKVETISEKVETEATVEDDLESQKAIFEQAIYAELHARAQHLMDFVYKHKLTRAQVLVALMDRA